VIRRWRKTGTRRIEERRADTAELPERRTETPNSAKGR
jgi:hypothetical protein